MIRSFAFFLMILVSGASSAAELSYKKFIANNEASISKLAVGMTKEQVMSTMGNHTSKVPDGNLSNPYKSESLQQGANSYEVLYFLTRIHPPFTPILDNQSTPVVLKDGLVVGWGRSALQMTKPQ